MTRSKLYWGIGKDSMHAELVGNNTIYKIRRVSQVKSKLRDCRHYVLCIDQGYETLERIKHKAILPLLQAAQAHYDANHADYCTPASPSRYTTHVWEIDTQDGLTAILVRGNHAYRIGSGGACVNSKVSDPLMSIKDGEKMGEHLNFFAAVARCESDANDF